MRTLWTVCFIALVACNDAEDYCAGIELPECPEECPDDYASTCGEPCETDGEACGNSIGDGRVCVDGMYTCSVHAPLEADECNKVCM